MSSPFVLNSQTDLPATKRTQEYHNHPLICGRACGGSKEHNKSGFIHPSVEYQPQKRWLCVKSELCDIRQPSC